MEIVQVSRCLSRKMRAWSTIDSCECNMEKGLNLFSTLQPSTHLKGKIVTNDRADGFHKYGLDGPLHVVVWVLWSRQAQRSCFVDGATASGSGYHPVVM